MSRRQRRPRSVHSCCEGCVIEPRNILVAGGGDFLNGRTQHGQDRYARSCSPCRGRRAHHAQKDRVGNWDIPHLADGKMPPRSASGRHVAVADDVRMREVGRGHSSWEAGEQGGAIPCGAGGAKGRGQGECRPATHALDPVPGCACHRRGAAYAPSPPRWERLNPRWEPYAGKPHVRICAGGGEQSPSLPRPSSASVWDGRYLGSVRRTGGEDGHVI